MNLTKLFEAQRVLDERIEKEHPRKNGESRISLKVLALLVEIGETANFWRGFKFWSKNQNPVTTSISPIFGTNVDGSQHQSFREYNPLLEELVDCLHFILSIGNELNIQDRFSETVNFNIGARTKITHPVDNFKKVFRSAAALNSEFVDERYLKTIYMDLFSEFTTLVDSLGFTEEQLETAYYEKNKINHERQDGGY